MNILKFVKSLSFIMFFVVSTHCLAQDSIKVVILSDEVGALLDANEKKKYGVVPKFGDEFVHAFFYLDNDKQYYCKVRLKTEDSEKDSILTYGYTSVKSVAGRIQYKENLKKGNSDFNINDVELKFEDGETARNFIKISSGAGIQEIIENDLKARRIPLAKTDTDYSQFVAKKFELGLGVGIIFNTYNFQDLSPIFYSIAEYVVKEPDKISESDFSINSFPIFSFSSMLIIQNTYWAEIEYALGGSSSQSSSLDYNSFSLSFSYLFSLSQNLSPFLSVGYSGFTFNAVQNYGLPITDNSEGTLESISLDGGGGGLKLSIGAIYNITGFISINLCGSYRFISPTKVNNDYQSTLNHEMNFDMNGYEIGIKILFRQ